MSVPVRWTLTKKKINLLLNPEIHFIKTTIHMALSQRVMPDDDRQSRYVYLNKRFDSDIISVETNSNFWQYVKTNVINENYGRWFQNIPKLFPLYVTKLMNLPLFNFPWFLIYFNIKSLSIMYAQPIFFSFENNVPKMWQTNANPLCA